MLIVNNNSSDENLVRLVLENDKEIFGVLIDRYKDKLSRYIYRITRVDDGQKDDILQDVFIKAYVNLNDFDTSLRFSSWIYRICHNQVISHHRKIKTKISKGYTEIDDETLSRISSNKDLIKELDMKEDKKKIDYVLGNMSSKHREVLVLKFLEDKDYKEMSDILQKPIGTVGTLIHRAKKEFIKLYNKEDYEK